MAPLNAIGFVNLPPPPPLPPSSSSSFRDRTSFAAHKHQQISLRPSANSLAGRSSRRIINMGGVFSARCSAKPDGGAPGKPFESWRNWVFGILLSIALPFAHSRWGKLLAIKNEVETAVKIVETVVEVVEKVAEGVAEVADEVGDHLPEGGQLKSAVETVEDVAKETAKNAHIADQLIQKVEEVEKEVGSVFVESTQQNAVFAEENSNKQEVQKNESDSVGPSARDNHGSDSGS